MTAESDGTAPTDAAGADGATEIAEGSSVGAGTAHVRGSTLLLVGRVLSIGINLVTQVLIARHLTQTEFGAFSLAVAIAGVGQVFITLGLHRGATQFFARYDETDDHSRLLGSILLNAGVIVGLGLLLFMAVALAQNLLTSSGLLDPSATTLLLILILLAPIDALDDMLIALFAVVGGSRQIFLRRYLVGPLLRLIVAASLVLTNGDATLLAVGYLLATIFGLVVYGAMFVRILADRGVLRAVRHARPTAPTGEMLRFSLPLLTNDGVWLLVNTLPLIVLTAVSGLEEVAAFQVIRPAAALNMIVANAFYVLYLPVASRLAVRRDLAGSTDLFWRTAIWVAVTTFPIFAVTFALGRPIAGLLFGERYEPSGTYLSILAVGYLINATFEFNGITLAAHGRTRTVAILNVVAAVAGVIATLVLIPIAGALGAAVAASLTLIAQVMLMQLALKPKVGIPWFDREATRVFAIIALATLALVVVVTTTTFGWWTIAAAALASVAVLVLCRDALRIEELFPEVGVVLDRLPWLRAARRGS
jgi:O-antigen/teichoic acid export membrane protein